MSGGRRTGAGRKKDPNSARSERLGVRFGELPREGYRGRRPAWPLTTKATPRERQMWNWAWRTPQAAAWSTEPWRHMTVALWCRFSVRAEEPDAPAAVMTVVLRLANQIGMTPGGLIDNGWKIQEAPAHPATEAAAEAQRRAMSRPVGAEGVPPARERLRVVLSGGDR